MTDENPMSLGAPTVDQCKAIYNSMLTPTVRSFHAKMIAAGYVTSIAGSQRFIARHIKKSPPKSHQAPAGVPSLQEETSLIQADLAELQPLDTAILLPRLKKELLIYKIMLLRFSQRNADRLAMTPKETAALVKAMAEASDMITAIPVTPGGKMIDVTPNDQNEVSNAIARFLKQEGVAN